MSAENFAKDNSYTVAGSPQMTNSALIHAYKANPRLRKANPSCYDLEATGNRFEFLPGDPIQNFVAGKELVLINPSNQVVFTTSVNPLSPPLASISLQCPSQIPKYTVAVQVPTGVHSLGRPTSLEATPLGQLLFCLLPIALVTVGGAIFNRIFNVG